VVEKSMVGPMSRAEDIRTPGFLGECRRQSRLIADSETEASRAEDEAWATASHEAVRHDR
jgi:hypothetical protein